MSNEVSKQKKAYKKLTKKTVDGKITPIIPQPDTSKWVTLLDGSKVDLNNMRELRNVVEELLQNLSMVCECVDIVNETCHIALNNAGVAAVNGDFSNPSIKKARAVMFITDLIYSIQLYLESGMAQLVR